MLLYCGPNVELSCIFHLIISYNNVYRSLHNLRITWSASFVFGLFANVVFGSSCSTFVRHIVVSLISKLNTSANLSVHSQM